MNNVPISKWHPCDCCDSIPVAPLLTVYGLALNEIITKTGSNLHIKAELSDILY